MIDSNLTLQIEVLRDTISCKFNVFCCKTDGIASTPNQTGHVTTYKQEHFTCKKNYTLSKCAPYTGQSCIIFLIASFKRGYFEMRITSVSRIISPRDSFLI